VESLIISGSIVLPDACFLTIPANPFWPGQPGVSLSWPKDWEPGLFNLHIVAVVADKTEVILVKNITNPSKILHYN